MVGVVLSIISCKAALSGRALCQCGLSDRGSLLDEAKRKKRTKDCLEK